MASSWWGIGWPGLHGPLPLYPTPLFVALIANWLPRGFPVLSRRDRRHHADHQPDPQGRGLSPHHGSTWRVGVSGQWMVSALLGNTSGGRHVLLEFSWHWGTARSHSFGPLPPLVGAPAGGVALSAHWVQSIGWCVSPALSGFQLCGESSECSALPWPENLISSC